MKHGDDYSEIVNDLADEFAIRVRFDYCTTRILEYKNEKCKNCPMFNTITESCRLKTTEKFLRIIADTFSENDVLNGGDI